MASIEKHISDLLCLHDCVIVPGMGGFVANHKPAVIVEERNLFQPPSKEIGFNRSLSHNDGLLANHICKREQSTWDESMALIDRFVSAVMTDIEKGVTSRFQGIGTFRKDALGNLQFTPNERNQLLPGAFGLSEFHFEPLHSHHPVRSHEEPVRRLLRSRSPRYWAAIAAMLAGLFLFTPELEMPDNQKIDTGNIMVSMSRSETEQTNPSETEISISAEVLTENTGSAVIADNKEAENPLNQNIENPHHLVAASFKTEAPAKHVLAQFQKDGFTNSSILHAANGRFRVSLYSYSDRSKAMEKLYALREQDRFKNIWLLTK
jgi:hypothetical protein